MYFLQAISKRPAQPQVWLQIHDNVPTRSLLDTALNHCTDAAELYLQGGCTGFAGEMATLAQQIALQISLLNASPTRLILNRSTEQLYKLVSEYLRWVHFILSDCISDVFFCAYYLHLRQKEKAPLWPSSIRTRKYCLCELTFELDFSQTDCDFVRAKCSNVSNVWRTNLD